MGSKTVLYIWYRQVFVEGGEDEPLQHLNPRAEERDRSVRPWLVCFLPDKQTKEDTNKKLTKKDYNRPDVIEAKQTERPILQLSHSAV